MLIEYGLLQNPDLLIQELKTLNYSSYVLISDLQVKPLYADSLALALINAGLHTIQLSFPSGEKNKTRATKEHLEDQMLESGVGADSCLIAIGGGVTTDLAGFLASTYCRGIPLILIPTTLLAMVDASIGGKNGVNTHFGKNLIGSLKEPKKVFIDPETLKTLNIRDLRDGFVEMIKHGLIVDGSLFDYFEAHAKELLSLERSKMESLIAQSYRIKTEIVEKDKKIKGIRNLLNFGHTIGHAIENLTDYTLSHGEAVAIGILVESYISFKLKVLDFAAITRIKKLFLGVGLPLKLPKKLTLSEMLQVMTMDKKSLKNQPRFTVIETIGSCLELNSNYCKPIEEPIIADAIPWMNQEFYN